MPIGDQIFEYEKQLRDGGFAAFVPYHEFLDSFCTCEMDHHLHRQCLIEGAKNRLGRPWPLNMFRPYGEHLYFSPFLRQLVDERDRQNGVSETELSSHYPGELWRREIDPCERRKMHKSITEREIYEVSWSHMLRKQREGLGLEAGRHATGLAAAYSFDAPDRYAFYTAAMERQASVLGFQLNKKSSRPNYPVFSKEAVGDWELCWTIDSKVLLWSPIEGYLVPRLAVRNRHLRGRLEHARLGEYFFIEYRHIVLGFGNAYWKFSDLDELETIVKAHQHFYGLMAPIIDGALAGAI